MTGFGAATGTVGTLRVSVELRTVNHRFFNPSIKLPGAFSPWEGDVREVLRKWISRGHVTVSVRYERDATSEVKIDEARFGAYAERIRELKKKFGVAGDVDVATIL